MHEHHYHTAPSCQRGTGQPSPGLVSLPPLIPSPRPAVTAVHNPNLFSLRRTFSWAVLGEVGYGACQWAMIVVLAKLGTVEMVGQLTLALAVTAPLFLLANLQLRALLASDGGPGGKFSQYFALRLLTAAWRW